MAAVWSVSPDSSRPDAQAASSGGIAIGGAAARRAGSRCWMTNVPAKTSPSRLPFADSREQMRAGTPMKGTSQKSTSRGETPDQGLPEALGAAVVADHPQAERELSRRSAPGRRLPDDRVADQGQDDDGDHDGCDRGRVHAVVRRTQPDDGEQDSDDGQLDRQVDGEGEHPAGKPGARHLEDDGLPGDDFGHVSSRSTHCAAKAKGRRAGSSLLPWTLTLTWPRTSPSGGGWTRSSSGGAG